MASQSSLFRFLKRKQSQEREKVITVENADLVEEQASSSSRTSTSSASSTQAPSTGKKVETGSHQLSRKVAKRFLMAQTQFCMKTDDNVPWLVSTNKTEKWIYAWINLREREMEKEKGR